MAVQVPATFPVQPITDTKGAKDPATCGTCGLTWDDGIATSWTPAPSGRCPFEYFHEYKCTHCGGKDAECLLCLGGGACEGHLSNAECKAYEDEHADDNLPSEAQQLAIQTICDHFGYTDEGVERAKSHGPDEAQRAWPVILDLLREKGVEIPEGE